MNIALVTNVNGKGLQVDAELLRDLLIAESHSVTLVQYNLPHDARYDLAIFLEVVATQHFVLAPRLWWIPNCEWTRPADLRAARRFERIFAKTLDADRILRAHFPSTTFLTGFLTRDKYDASIPRLPRFLHLGGESAHSNTFAVIAAWGEWRFWLGPSSTLPDLTVVSNSTEVPCPPTPGITYLRHGTDDEIRHLQNSHLFHLLPSAYEGFGHSLHESQSVGAITLTTDAAPMNTVVSFFNVPSIRQRTVNLATLHEVSPRDIREAIPKLINLSILSRDHIHHAARQRFLDGNARFRDLFLPHLAPQPAAVLCNTKSSIAILGNFREPYSTENDLAWTLRDMGHEVVEAQEDGTTTEEILAACHGIDLLVYIRTHGWHTPGRMSLDDLWEALRRQHTRTCSFHLDRYWGLNEFDQRERRIGNHAFWRTERVFTADGGNQDKFAAKGVKHYWLPPGVSKRWCYQGTPQPELLCDIGFVGARHYHPEYAFRTQLIEFLEDTYGDRFRIFNGYRGESLNDLYASIPIMVGDSCFAGADHYWSDRVPETLGRGGFLIHPATSGLTIPGLVTFTPGNLDELKDRIDYYLNKALIRSYLRIAAARWVYDHETYHNRMSTLLTFMELA